MATYDILCLAELAIDQIGSAKNITDDESSTLMHGLKRFYGGIGGNFVATASLFGARLSIIASMGQEDPDSADYKNYLKSLGVDTSNILQADWSTLSKCFIINQGDEKSRIFFYPGTIVQEPKKYFTYAKEKIGKIKSKALFVSSADFELNKLFLRESGAKIKAYAPAHNAHRHTKEDFSSSFENSDILFVNDHESQIIEKVLKKNIFEIAKEYGINIIAKTLGEDGSEIIIDGEPTAIRACAARRVLDPSGAGDAFAAAFMANYVKSEDPIFSARVASAAASFIVEEIGCQSGIPNMEMLRKRVKNSYGSETEERMY